MAMKNLLKAGLVLFGCGLVTVAMLPPARLKVPPGWDQESSELSQERYRIRSALGSAVRAWRGAERRDSASRIIAREFAGAAPNPRVLSDASLSRDIRDAAEGAIHESWHRLRIDSAKVNIAVFVLRDSLPDHDDFGIAQSKSEGAEFFISSNPDGTPICAPMMLLREISDSRTATLRFLRGMSYPRSTLFGPCTFYGAFGQPGARIAEWMKSRRYDVAMWADWQAERTVAKLYRPYGSSFLGVLSGDSDLNNLSYEERACWLGNWKTCEDIVLDSADLTAQNPIVQDLYPATTRGWNRDWPFQQYLSDMRREFGAGKFAKFWTSSEEPSVAFSSATGMTLGAWTHKWVLSHYGPSVAGAKIPGSYFAIGLLLAVGCVSIATVVSKRRSIG